MEFLMSQGEGGWRQGGGCVDEPGNAATGVGQCRSPVAQLLQFSLACAGTPNQPIFSVSPNYVVRRQTKQAPKTSYISM